MFEQIARGLGAVVAVTAQQGEFLLASSMSSMSKIMRCGGRTKLRQ